MITDQTLGGAAWFKVRLLKKVWLLLFPQVDLCARSHGADPIGQPQTEMVGEPWCNFLQHLLMCFAWCSPVRRLPARKMFRSLLISEISFATSDNIKKSTAVGKCHLSAALPHVFSMWPLCLNAAKVVTYMTNAFTFDKQMWRLCRISDQMCLSYLIFLKHIIATSISQNNVCLIGMQARNCRMLICTMNITFQVYTTDSYWRFFVYLHYKKQM